MKRDRAFFLTLLVSIGILLLGTAAAWIWPSWAMLAVLLTGTGILAAFGVLWSHRNRQLAQLSQYLRQVERGEPSLDIRDNREGELSVLKNEIYKATTRLLEQDGQTRSQKRYLADSISDISHQLKTPLTSMMVMTDLLQSEDLPADERRRFTDAIHTQLTRIEWLVTSLLKLAKLDAGTVHFKTERIDVAKLLKQAAAHLLIAMELKEQTLSVTGADGIFFTGDFNWSAEGIANIIKNCIEHTPQGGEIRVACKETSMYLQITIADNGEGIDKEDLPHIFERFYRGKNAQADSVGIGLAMAKQIFLQQNGTLTVESEASTGTRFCLKLYKRVV